MLKFTRCYIEQEQTSLKPDAEFEFLMVINIKSGDYFRDLSLHVFRKLSEWCGHRSNMADEAGARQNPLEKDIPGSSRLEMLRKQLISEFDPDCRPEVSGRSHPWNCTAGPTMRKIWVF